MSSFACASFSPSFASGDSASATSALILALLQRMFSSRRYSPPRSPRRHASAGVSAGVALR